MLICTAFLHSVMPFWHISCHHLQHLLEVFSWMMAQVTGIALGIGGNLRGEWVTDMSESENKEKAMTAQVMGITSVIGANLQVEWARDVSQIENERRVMHSSDWRMA